MFSDLRHFRSSSANLLTAVLLALFTLALVPGLHAADNEDFDNYKLRIDGFWFYSNPSGNIQGSGPEGQISINQDLGFDTYSTVSGLVDWRFTRKNHLVFAFSPYQQTRNTILNRTITYQGQTFDIGLNTDIDLKAHLFAPGYQYDIIRRKRGHLGIGVQIDLFDTSASLMAQAQVTSDGVHHAAVSGSGSLLAPIPVAGPQYRLYLTDSPRLFVEGDVYGMYLFGYGNFISTADTLGLTLNRHLSVNAGYQLGSRLVVNNNNSDRIGVHLTQKGALVGMEVSF